MESEKYWEDLGRRAVACPGWLWMPGMLTLKTDARPLWSRAVDVWDYTDDQHPMFYSGDDLVHARGIPDLRDPATVGCLLALVREAVGPGAVTVVISVLAPPPENLAWGVFVACPHGRSLAHGKMTEAEALVAALEEAT